MAARLIETLEQRQLLAVDSPVESLSSGAPRAAATSDSVAAAEAGAAISIKLNGNAVNADQWVDLGNVQKGVVTIKNTGSSTLTLSGVTLSDSSSFQISDSLPSQLAPGKSATFSVQLSSSSFGEYITFVTVTSNANGANTFRFRVRMAYAPGTGTGAASGTVYNDVNGNGKRESKDKGLAGRRVYVDLDGDGQLHELEPSAVTDAKGNYTIRNVPPGTFRVRDMAGNKWRVSTPTSGFRTVTFVNGKTKTKQNYGQTQRAAVLGTIFRDADGDGVREAGDIGLNKFRVYLDLDNDGVFDKSEPSATTNSAGIFFIKNAPAGKQTLRVQTKAGFKHSGKPMKLKLALGTVKIGVLLGEKPSAKA